MKKFYPIVRRKFQWELLLITILLFTYPSISKATFTGYGTNSVTNGNAENATDLFGWTLVGTGFSSYATGSAPTPKDGTKVFDYYSTTLNSSATITQTISLSAISSDISAGKVKAVLTGSIYKTDLYGTKIARIKLEELNLSGSVLSSQTADCNSTLSWEDKTLTISILNASTTQIRITLYGEQTSPVNGYCDFDLISLILYRLPTVTNTAASSITTSSAVLGGNVTTDGTPANTGRGVVYSTTNTNPTIGGANVATVAIGSGAGSFSQTISGLSGAQLYYYNAYATNTLGTVYGTANSFTTLTPTYLTATTTDATSVTINSATLNGSVNANGNTTNCYFQYGTTISYGTTVAASPATATGTSATTETLSVTGLSSTTTYHFRMAAYNSTESWKYGDDKTFTTLTPVPEMDLKQGSTAIADGGSYDFGYHQPSTTTDIVFTIQNTGTSALTLTTPITIGGTNADQFSIQAQPTSPVAAAGSTTFTIRFSPTSTGNKSASLSIVNNDSNENPYDLTITGQGYLSPSVTSSAASNILATTVTLNGSVNANYNSTTATFQYGLTTSYGSTVTASQSPVTGTSSTPVSYNLTGLTSNTTYHYRAVGTNLGGTIYGSDQTFTTPVIEHFTDEMENGLSFTTDGFSFTLTGNLKDDYWAGHGWNGSVFDERFISDYDVMLSSAGIMGSIKNTSNNFYANSLWVAPGNASRTLGQYGNVIIRGKRSGTTLFTYTLTSANTNNNYAVNNNYTFIDLAAYNSTLIDELEFEVTDNIRYIEIDAFNFNVPAAFTPTVTTQAVTNVGSTNAIGNGNITVLGNPNPTAYGICWGTSSNPTTSNSKVDKGAATVTGAFTAQLTGLTPGATYHARAFATNTSGTVYGGDVTFTTTATMTEPGNALNFDGSNDYVVTTDNDNSLTAFTIEAWVKWTPSSATDIQFICGKGMEQMEIHTGSGANGLRFIPTTGVYLDAANVLTTDVWTHVAVVYNPSASLAKMYINGAEVTLVKSGGNPLSTAIANTTTPFYLGRRSDGTYRFKGSMDEVRVWNLVRSQSEIQADMDNAISASSSGLINYYNFNEGTTGSMMLPDLTSNTNNGTLTNFALTGTTSNWVESYAMVVPTATAASSITASGFTANWTAPVTGTVNNYKLYVSTNATFTSLVAGYNPLTVASPSTSSAVTGLATNTTYYYRVCADKTSVTGEGAYSNAISLNTLKVPTVTTQAVTSISVTTATGNGTITDLGVPNPTAYGVCWNTSGTPTISDSKNDKGAASATGAFTASMTGLTAGTTYHVRAFATNTAGTVYGTEEDFTSYKVPTVTTQAVSGIGTTTATGNGTITDLGVPNPTAYGVCWNTTGTPTTSDSKNDKGVASATGAFTASMASLTAGTTYHVRAFATNTAGTVYGAEEDFTSLKVPTVTTQAVSGIGTTTATGNGTITDLGVPNPTAYGICWNTTGTPTTSDSKNDKGAASATGAFTASMASLTAGTTYHVRAFATNTAGTVYGAEEDFTSLKVPTVTTQAVSGIGTTTATGNGTITDLGVPNPTAYGVCWNTTGTPTTSDSKNDIGAASATGAFTASMASLTAGTSYHVRAFATNTVGTVYGDEEDFTTLTAGTWTGATNSNWATASNWAGGSVPISTSNVIIPDVTNDPVIGATSSADCHNLTVNSGASLTIESSGSGTGSLIVTGTPTGNVTCQSYMTADVWHMVSSPVSGQTIASFLAANSLIAAKSGTDTRAMKNYFEATDVWSDYFTNSTSGNLGGGKGFSVIVWATTGGTVNYTGTLQTGNVDLAITRTPSTGFGWNLIGNPYSSAIAINTAAGVDNFINNNSSALNQNYCGIYYWNGSAYVPVNLSDGAFYAQVGQGFFVKSKTGGGTISFTPSMQTHRPTTEFKNAVIPWPEIKLVATLGDISNNTVIRFNDAMNQGLDVGYDAGIMKSGFDVYTKLVDDNGVDFGIQCLPLTANKDMVIPIGLESNNKGSVALSLDFNNFPSDCQVTFEDRETGMFTPVSKSGQVDNIQVAAKSKVVGRFFLHASYLKNTTGITSLPEDWRIYVVHGQICISGSVTGNATAAIYDLLGRKVGTYQLQNGSLNHIPCADFRNGVYLISIRQQHGIFTKKISVIN